jgi:hypothetical protein
VWKLKRFSGVHDFLQLSGSEYLLCKHFRLPVYPNTMSPTESRHTPPPSTTIHQLVVKQIFDALELREKFYAHHLARAAWHGSKIIMRQVSPESPDIFDFIMDLYQACGGKWDTLVTQCNITSEELASFLEYAAMFLCNLGNFYVSSASCCWFQR